MPSTEIQWFPGHMAKTRRLMTEALPKIDVIIEILDARIPYSSKNPELDRMAGSKPMLTVLSKSALADPASSASWKSYYTREGHGCIFCDFLTGAGVKDIPEAVKRLVSEKLARYAEKGMTGRTVKAMVAGIPNVGKSTLINKLAGSKRAKTEDRPGVTRDKQWVTTPYGIDLLDTPGVLWPKFGERRVGENLAMTGAIKDDILDTETIAVALCSRLRKKYPALLSARYKLDTIPEEMSDAELFELIGRKRGFLISGGEVSYERTAVMLLDEFRAGKIGRITLEEPK